MTPPLPLRSRDYLRHMVDASKRIELYVDGRKLEDFLSESLVQDAVLRNLEVLGEAARSFLAAVPDAAARFPSVPWRLMYVTRNRIIHGYVDINLKTIWEVATSEVSEVRAEFEAILAAWPNDLS